MSTEIVTTEPEVSSRAAWRRTAPSAGWATST